MKIIILLVLLLSTIIAKETKQGGLNVYSKYKDNKVQLKWIPSEYKSSNTYKIYRSEGASKEILIATVKPTSYEELVRKSFNEDYLKFVYPLKNVKNVKERIKAFKEEELGAAFRILRFMKDNQFAKNIGQFYIDRDVKKSKNYTYKIVLVNKNKEISTKVLKIKTVFKDKNIISWIKAKNTLKGAKLTWDTSGKYSYYNIYRKLDGDKKFLKQTKSPLYISPEAAVGQDSLYVDNRLAEGEKAKYYIKRIDIFMDEGKASREVSAKRLTLKESTRIKNIYVKNSSTKTILRWKKINDILGYNIYRSISYNGKYKKLNKKPVKKEVYVDRSFDANQEYYYYITSLGMNFESSPSIKMLSSIKDVIAPAFPKNLKAKTKAGEVILNWKAQNEKDLLGYKLYFSMDKEATEWAQVNKTFIEKNSYVHKRPKSLSRHFYYYRVSAVDKMFNESAMSNIVKVKLPDVTKPAQPVFSRHYAYSSKVILAWSDVIVYDFSHYNLYKKSNGKLIKLNKTPLTNTKFTDINLNDGINEYVVTSVDKSANESKTIKSLKVMRPDIKPVKIENFKVKKEKNKVDISFTCKDKDYNGFEVFRASGKVMRYSNVSGFKKEKNYTDTRIHKNVIYFYKIKVYDKAGNIKISNVVEINTKENKQP